MTRTAVQTGVRSARVAMIVNAALAGIKLVAGIVGNTYALIADAIESTADIFSSLIVWGGLHLSAREPDDDYPFGYGKAESLAAAVVAMLLLAAGVSIMIQAAREIRTPHHSPAPWTLIVLVVVIAVKWTLSRRVGAVGAEIGSGAVKADAWHHLSDALTSAAAFIGISIAVVGNHYHPGSRWETADDWAAVAAAFIILASGARLLRPALQDLMDRVPGSHVVGEVRTAAESVAEVLATEKIAVRRTGLTFRVTLHVQADPKLSLDEAHKIGGAVKTAIRRALPQVSYVLVHMEPYYGGAARR